MLPCFCRRSPATSGQPNHTDTSRQDIHTCLSTRVKHFRTISASSARRSSLVRLESVYLATRVCGQAGMSNRAEGVQAATGVHSPKHGWQTSTRLALFGLPRGTPYLALLVHQQHKLDHGSPRACSGSGAVVGNQALLLLRHCCCLSRLTYDSTVLLLYQSWQNRTSAAQTSQKLQSCAVRRDPKLGGDQWVAGQHRGGCNPACSFRGTDVHTRNIFDQNTHQTRIPQQAATMATGYDFTGVIVPAGDHRRMQRSCTHPQRSPAPG